MGTALQIYTSWLLSPPPATQGWEMEFVRTIVKDVSMIFTDGKGNVGDWQLIGTIMLCVDVCNNHLLLTINTNRPPVPIPKVAP